MTNRSVAAKVVKATAPIKIIVKYEMYFLLGLVSTANMAALIIVVGTDMAVTGIVATKKVLAAKKLSKDLLAESKSIEQFAPTLHSKLEAFIQAQAKVKWKSFGKRLPETIVKDEKTQAQLAGVLVGNAVLSPKAFTVWTAVFTILTTAVIKSVTKSPEAYAQVINQRYKPILDELKSVDWNNTAAAATQAANKFKKMLEESGIEVSNAEALAILQEVYKNSDKLEISLKNIDKSFREFLQAIED